MSDLQGSQPNLQGSTPSLQGSTPSLQGSTQPNLQGSSPNLQNTSSDLSKPTDVYASGGSSVPTPTFAQHAQDVPQFTYDLGAVNPMSDLSYNAFLRGYGMSKSTAEAQAAYQRGSLNAQLQAGAPQFDTMRKEGVTDANESSAARGAVRSSSNLLSQDNVVRDVNNKEAAFRQGIADQQAQVAFGLQNTLNGLETQRAEQEMQARQNQLELVNKQVAYQKAISDLGLDPSLQGLLSYGYSGGQSLNSEGN